MFFWFKNLILALLLLGLAAYILMGEQLAQLGIISPDQPQQSATPSKTPPVQQLVAATKPVPRIEVKEDQQGPGAFGSTSSSAATGLSNFYSKVRGDLLGESNNFDSDYVIKVKPSIYTLDEQLMRRGRVVTPGNPRFEGQSALHRFNSGKTMKSQLSIAAQKDGLALIWNLERDYVIKHFFSVKADLLATLNSVAKAIDSDFEKDVHAFYCFGQRAVIITDSFTDYVKASCTEITQKGL